MRACGGLVSLRGAKPNRTRHGAAAFLRCADVRDVTFSFHPVGGDRRFYVDADDVRSVIARLPKRFQRALARVRFDDVGWETYKAGYSKSGSREIALCALPPRVSLTRFLPSSVSPHEFGAVRGSQWPALAVGRYQLYHVFPAMLIALEGRHGDGAAEMGTEARKLRHELWESASETLAPLHHAPGDDEQARIAEHWKPAHAAYKRGLLLERQGEFEPAERAFREALEHEPTHPLALEHLGAAAVAGGRVHDAVELLQKAVAADHTLPRAHLLLGTVLAQADQQRESRVVFERALEIHPQPAVSLAVYASFLARWGAFEEADAHFKRALRKDPSSGLPHRAFGVSLLEREDRRDRERGLELLGRAVALDPLNAESFFQLGRALASVEETHPDAVDALERAVGLEPDHPRAAQLLALLRGEAPEPEDDPPVPRQAP